MRSEVCKGITWRLVKGRRDFSSAGATFPVQDRNWLVSTEGARSHAQGHSKSRAHQLRVLAQAA
eukprot:4543211-Pleurochrysis_carterae.AAC.2